MVHPMRCRRQLPIDRLQQYQSSQLEVVDLHMAQAVEQRMVLVVVEAQHMVEVVAWVAQQQGQVEQQVVR